MKKLLFLITLLALTFLTSCFAQPTVQTPLHYFDNTTVLLSYATDSHVPDFIFTSTGSGEFYVEVRTNQTFTMGDRDRRDLSLQKVAVYPNQYLNGVQSFQGIVTVGRLGLQTSCTITLVPFTTTPQMALTCGDNGSAHQLYNVNHN